jgi:hypothetical protein
VADPQVSVYMNDLPTPGMLCMSRVPLTGDTQEPVKEWSEKPVLHKNVCLRVEPDTAAYSPEKVADGYARPFAGPHEWVSAPLADGPAELTATWSQPQSVAQVDLVFDDDVNEDLINLHHHRTPFETMPSLVRDYRLQARIDGAWVDQQVVTENRTRHHRHVFEEPVRTDALRLVVEATNGDPWARVVALRAYPEPLIR